MPIYEYHCEKCDCEFETLVISSSEKIVCPKCESPKVKKLMSAASFKSGGNYSSSAGSSCSGCTSTNCSTCH